MTIKFKDVNRYDPDEHLFVDKLEIEKTSVNFMKIRFREKVGAFKIWYTYFVEWLVIEE